MTDKRISALTAITGTDVDDANDVIAIVDSSASETKKITRAQLFSSVASATISTVTGNLVGNVTGNLTGNLTGNVTGDLTGDVTGDLTGDVTGNVTGDLTGDVTGNLTGNLTGNVTGDLTGDVTGELDLTAIATTKAETAVDVFVYDTSRDSDGGAWRKRTQNTSWYNETLNTSTRGSRREFPAVAVIVAESDTVTIYDGDDPALPMWMVFTGGASFNNIIAASGGITSVFMLNGRLGRGATPTSSYDFVCVDLVGDRAARAGTSSIYGPYKGNIEQRNDALGWLSATENFLSSGPILSRAVNDVAMTVLPDSPIDPATGLPVPTILVGTDGNGTYSTSIITDSGDVYDIASDSTGTAVSVAFDGVSAVVTRSDGTVYVWNDAGDIAADGASPDATYSASSTPALLGAVSEVAA